LNLILRCISQILASFDRASNHCLSGLVDRTCLERSAGMGRRSIVDAALGSPCFRRGQFGEGFALDR
jgi:hypothetical protein